MSWPPTLDELKTDMKHKPVTPVDPNEDERLEQVLDAAVAYVERVRGSSFNFAADPDSLLPDPTTDLWLGTMRLAGRWHTRRRSPDALVDMGELGGARVPGFDPDIERLLGIGRFAGPVFA